MVGVVAALVSEWLTPTSLFIIVNIVIATILISSHPNKNRRSNDDHLLTSGDHRPKSKPKPEPEHRTHTQLVRTPSLFSRVTSFNLTSHYFPNPDQHESAHLESEQAQPEPEPVVITGAPSFLSRVASFRVPSFRRGFTQPDPAHPEHDLPTRDDKEKVMEKSDEQEGSKGEEKPVEAVKRKEGGKQAPVAKTSMSSRRERDHEEVDAKADDFINRFKQQLKLQRLESLIRYRNATS